MGILKNAEPVRAWRYMDYVEQTKSSATGGQFTFAQYRELKRKPPKVETKPETKPEADAEGKR